MGIPDEDVARVRAATDIVALIGEHAALKRQGRRWVGLCPFHGEKTPSFSVNAEEGFYYCFGCQAKGDAISFVRAIEHLDFVDAVRRLADKAGHHHPRGRHAGRDSQRRKVLLDAMEQATEWYHQRLLDRRPTPARPATTCAAGATTARWSGGSAWGGPPTTGTRSAPALELTRSSPSGPGLGFVNRRGRLQDAFRARVLFPICDPSGHPVALGGPVLPGSTDPAKYKNSTETPIYSKRKTLYALNWAKQDIIAPDEVVVCEGYTDVIGLFGAGVERAVATCGTALAEEHVKLLRSFASRVVLAFDADGAGQSAAGRFYEWERRLEIDVAVAALPAGSDPGELARTDPEGLQGGHRGAKPFLQFRVERILDAAELATPEGRAKAADAALAAVAEHPDNLVRDQYLMQVAERCRLEPRRCGSVSSSSAGRARPEAAARPGAGGRPRSPTAAAGRDRPQARGAESRGSASPTTTAGTPTASTPAGAGRTATAGPAHRATGPGAGPAPRVPARARGAPPGHPPTRGGGRPAGGRPVPRRPPAGGVRGPGRRRRSSTRPSTGRPPRSGPCWSG